MAVGTVRSWRLHRLIGTEKTDAKLMGGSPVKPPRTQSPCYEGSDATPQFLVDPGCAFRGQGSTGHTGQKRCCDRGHAQELEGAACERCGCRPVGRAARSQQHRLAAAVDAGAI